ncbi:5-phosphohydroxy-L-lysine phospho-lyase-like [Bacillus rossius redtenbacheri]|uniref:5-phosphohydroxy-L-lysine phospho-lyase-like n=1 Tax=Bacillus rossius redtenbacheri TaxID=93214 RepID=UPI002FDDF2D1
MADRAQLSREETLMLRRTYVADSCELHFAQDPLKIVSSRAQYLVDDCGFEYLDCASRTNNVGHCHPAVVQAATSQMGTLNTCILESEIDDSAQREFSAKLLNTLPPNFDVCFFTTSGTEANDLALQLARSYTQRNGIVVVDGSFHGASQLVMDISPKVFPKQPPGKKPWVHVVPCPDVYRGPYGEDDPEHCEKYVQDSKSVIDKAMQDQHKVACFISEPVMVVYGVVVPPKGWLSKIYSYIHKVGGLVIADEIQTGLGRCGSALWTFQALGAVPDIVTIGKGVGCGHPMAGLVTSRQIANSMPDIYHRCQCSPVAGAIGKVVLDVLQSEGLQENARKIGTHLLEQFRRLRAAHRCLGDVRGMGLIIGVEIVWSQESRKPSPQLAEKLANKLREQQVIVTNEGQYSNVLVFLPSLCLTLLDADSLTHKMDTVLMEVEVEESFDVGRILNSQPSSSNGLYDCADESLSPSSDENGASTSYNTLD